jgi:putative ABC transport system permease protein
MRTVISDLRLAARTLLKSPGFAAVAIVSLALGIGANTAIFQLIDAVRLRTLPVKSPQELAGLRIGDMTHARGNWLRNDAFTNPLWEQIRQRQQVFSEIFAWADEEVNLSRTGEARFAKRLWVSGNLFDTLGIRPILGRVFTPADDRRGCGLAGAVISYGFWQREFGGSASVIGKKIVLGGAGSAEVIGVTPPSFFGLEVGRQFDLAMPICSVATSDEKRLDSGTTWWLTVMGRLKPGVSVAQADAHFQAISSGVFEATLPADYPPVSVKPYLAMKLNAIAAGGGVSYLRDQYSTPLGLLLAIAGLVLLIACANLANLMLARASAREREIAVRLAIGASRARLIQQLMTEGLLIAMAGAGAALFLARELSQFLVAFLGSGGNSVFLDVRPDWRVFGFTAFLALLTCVFFALAPALRATRAQPGDVLKSGSRGMTAGRERFGLRRILVASQIALSLVLMVGALLFVRTLNNLMTIEPGFHENGVLIARVSYGWLDLSPSRLSTLRRDLVEHIQGIPGVDAAAETASIPISGSSWTNIAWMDGSDSSNGRDISRSLVGPGYFHTIGTPLLGGREFDDRDTPTSQNAAIVSEEFARKFFLGLNPIGKRFWIEKTPMGPQIVCEIVGLVKNSKYADLRQDFMPVAYFPISQFPQPVTGGSILIRSGIGFDALTPSVRRAISDVNPNIGYSFSVFKTRIEESLLRERLMAILSGLFGGLAVLLATVGLYGVISYTVARRTNEIGIRIALGAGRNNVMGLILRETGMLLIVGLSAGVLIALVAGRAAATLLFGLQPNDPLTFVAAGAVLAMVALVASYVPARRAARVDPMVALRHE